MEEKTAVIARVGSRQTSKGEIFLVFDGDNNEYSTWDRGLYDRASVEVGKVAVFKFATTQNRGFTNYQLDNFQVVDGASPVVIAPAPAAGWGPPPTSPAPPQHTQNPKHPIDQKAIARAVALQSAVATLPQLAEPVTDPAQVTSIADFYFNYLTN